MTEPHSVVSIARKYELLEGMSDPSQPIESLIDAAFSELKIKYPAYHNSYQDTDKLNLSFWKKRLSNEVNEYKKCLTSAERKRKLANLFNLVWMAYRYQIVTEAKS